MRAETIGRLPAPPAAPAVRPAEAVAGPGDDPGGGGPVFIAGPDRSGTTLLYALLGSHPNLCMVRRTNMWRYFHRRYGDLSEPDNLERCLSDMTRYRKMRHLRPDAERIRHDFQAGAPTYGRLFALFYQHHAEREGKPRWGDKSLHNEHFADRIFAEFPHARIVHLVRDPRDRYASVRRRHGRNLSRVGAATGRWLLSARAGQRNLRRYPDRYLMIRYEDLARDPEGTLRHVCTFIGERYAPQMLSMSSAPEHRRRGGNSSFGDLQPGVVSTRAIGRFREVLSPYDLAFIDLAAGRTLRRAGYDRARPALRPRARLRWYGCELPVNLGRMAGWVVATEVALWRGMRLPASRLTEGPPA